MGLYSSISVLLNISLGNTLALNTAKNQALAKITDCIFCDSVFSL